MNESAKNPTPPARRRDRLIHERVHDPYRSKGKLPDPTLCPQCGAVFHQGRWTWLPRPTMVHEELCPACHRIRDKYPAGFLSLHGGFLDHHKQEIVNLVRHEEKAETTEHPLHRIIQIEEQADGVLITTTDIHLPRRIGEALRRAYQGQLDFHYIEEESTLDVHWTRQT
jgi:NMD protein affecting ribosome stability and mRNA decay